MLRSLTKLRPVLFLVHKYQEYKQNRKQVTIRKVTERELLKLNHKIDKLLQRLEEHQSENPSSSSSLPGEECVICINAKATMQTFPCGHRVVCRKCFVRTIQVAVSQRMLPLKCVICRAKILRLNVTGGSSSSSSSSSESSQTSSRRKRSGSRVVTGSPSSMSSAFSSSSSCIMPGIKRKDRIASSSSTTVSGNYYHCVRARKRMLQRTEVVTQKSEPVTSVSASVPEAGAAASSSCSSSRTRECTRSSMSSRGAAATDSFLLLRSIDEQDELRDLFPEQEHGVHQHKQPHKFDNNNSSSGSCYSEKDPSSRKDEEKIAGHNDSCDIDHACRRPPSQSLVSTRRSSSASKGMDSPMKYSFDKGIIEEINNETDDSRTIASRDSCRPASFLRSHGITGADISPHCDLHHANEPERITSPPCFYRLFSLRITNLFS